MPQSVPGLAEAIEGRLAQLGLSPTDFARATGLTQQGLAPLRRGDRRQYQKRLTSPVCKVLGWTPDSIDRLLEGKKPKMLAVVRPLDDLSESPEMTEMAQQVADLIARVKELEAERQPSATRVRRAGGGSR